MPKFVAYDDKDDDDNDFFVSHLSQTFFNNSHNFINSVLGNQ